MRPVSVSEAYGWGLGWCTLHFLIYWAWLRSDSRFRTEGWILCYHLVSAITYSTLGFLMLFWSPLTMSFPDLAGMIAGHGIYSISFLELWSLAQGGYSLTILGGVDVQNGATSRELIDRFGALGNLKKEARITVLYRFGLAFQRGGRIELTRWGRLAAAVCALLRWLPNVRDTG